MIEVKEQEDGSFTISWDPNDPIESIFNTWSEDDFTQAILDYANEILENNAQQTNTSNE